MTYERYWKSSPQTWERLKGAARENRRAPTTAEAVLWDRLRSSRLSGLKFRRQHAIGPYIVDFYCPAARLVVEVDGPVHEQHAEEDEDRTRFLEAMKLHVVRLANQQVIEHTEDVLETIRTAIARASLGED